MAGENGLWAAAREEGVTARADWVAGVYETHSERVYRFMRYRVDNAAYAEDLTSLVFERILEKADSYDEKKGGVEVWLFRIARNVLYDHYRRAARLPRMESLEAAGGLWEQSGTPEEILLGQERSQALLAALRRLGRREWCVVALKYAGGLRHADIAGVMGLSEKNVGVILSRSRAKLRVMLEGELE